MVFCIFLSTAGSVRWEVSGRAQSGRDKAGTAEGWDVVGLNTIKAGVGVHGTRQGAGGAAGGLGKGCSW